jgi:hypothetical protein
MSKYLVRCKASVYYDVEIETKEKWDAEAEGLDMFPSPLEWEGAEVWEVDEVTEDA